MLLSSLHLPATEKDTITSVAIAACTHTQIAVQNHSAKYIRATSDQISAMTIASSTGLVVISDPQIAH